MLVFREGRRVHSGSALLEALVPLFRQLSVGPASQPDRLMEALLRSGELECGLADAASPHAAGMAAVTDALAEMLLGRRVDCSKLLERLTAIVPPAQITVSTPEGFAYYSLHPRRYADLAVALPLASPYAAVLGIRSIGTTLSAVVAAALRRRGLVAERITVRPAGHPFDRQTEFSSDARRWIAAQRARQAEFLVVD